MRHRLHDLGGGESTGYRQLSPRMRTIHYGGSQPWTDQEFRAGIETGVGLIGCQNRARADEHTFAVVLHHTPNSCDRIRHGHRDFHDRNTASQNCLDGTDRLLRSCGPNHGNDTHLADPANCFVNVHQREIRAECDFITRRTSSKVAMVVSPGVVMASAPCAAPHSTVHWASFPLKKPQIRPETKESPPPTRS